MATFTAIALVRLLEPGTSRSAENSGPNLKPPIPKPKPITNSKMEKSSNTSATRKVNRPQISPSLYATPEATPLPDSPISFSPSPYIINHKRRGPRLLKSFSEDNVSSREKTLEEDGVNGKAKLAESKSVDQLKDGFVAFSIPEPNGEEHDNGAAHNCPINIELENGVHGGSIQEEHVNGFRDGEFESYNGEGGSSQINNDLPMDASVLKIGPLNLDRCDSEDFFYLNESMSVTSNTEGGDDTGAESASRFATPGVEFFDAWEELSPASAPQTIPHNIEAELREIRLSLLTEIEKRKQAEEALNKIQSNWRRIGQELGDVGLSLPVDLNVTEDELVNQAEELRQQVGAARFVSLYVGRGITRAEIEMEMEAQIELKNFEIARLLDRLHFYEAVNQEMSQRNQEAVEMARRDRQSKERRQRWVWGSVATAITLGTAALAWSYLPTGKVSSSASIPKCPDDNPTAK
ncbi:hypothetical protein like AT3G50910 [Hibiscus trionum]|uniref:Netrin receptor DCC n=1 Tax=Hibiscus trionum TaxID=183268 RepID=A0A9W7LKU2_HIBTR|nr:hypothetical protein like AT3G50910 [Hibiscus trionum]